MGGNGPTAFHQDFITFALDRSGGMQFWIPLDKCGPEQGTMAFISGSHRLGVLGDYQTYADRTIFDLWPELAEMPLAGPLHYEVGDVSVHDHLTVHGAGPNLGDRPRWALIASLVPGDARWTGAPPEAFDPAPLRPRDLLDEARFPLLVPPEGEP
ncbi:MAG: hypothetical protein KatS3mg124_0640 [Porticoccaceae bacterium]|nr:MAG: hypothetical protein KatS3mg124_0640 [Porticoccaceae bacterium]